MSINKHSAGKRHSRINSKGGALCETKITPHCSLRVPSAGCGVLAVSSQGPCLLLRGKKHVWLQKPWGSSLSLQDCDTEKLGPTYEYTVGSSARYPTSANLLRAVKIPGKITSTCMDSSLSPSLALTGSLQHTPLPGPSLGVSPMLCTPRGCLWMAYGSH